MEHDEAAKPSLKTRIIHTVTGHYPPENASVSDILRLIIHSPRSLAGTACALVTMFFLWQSLLMLHNPYSRYLLRPRRNVDAELATRLSPPPPIVKTESASLEDMKVAAQSENFQDAYNMENGTAIERISLDKEPAKDAAPEKGKKHSKADKKHPAHEAAPPAVQPDEGMVPLLRDTAVHNDNVLKSHYLPEAPRGVEKNIDSTLLVNASSIPVAAAIASASTAPLAPGTTQIAVEISTAPALDANRPVALQKMPPPLPPPPPLSGNSSVWLDVVILFLIPFGMAKASQKLKEPLLSELCARAAFIFSLVLAASGLMQLLDNSHILEGLAEVALGVWQIRVNAGEMTRRFGFVPAGLGGRLLDLARQKGWLKK